MAQATTPTFPYVWEPSPERIDRANVSRLMRALGFGVYLHDLPAHEREVRAFVARSCAEPAWFWPHALLDQGMFWFEPYERLLDVSRGPQWADWFSGGRTNIAAACVDRHASGPTAQRIALIAETEDGRVRQLSYADLSEQVGRLAKALLERGVKPGDRVASYLPMLAEAVVAMLATQKVGAIFIPIFSGYAPPAVRERLLDAEVSVVFTADTALRRGREIALKQACDLATEGLAFLHTVVVVQRDDARDCPMQSGRDVFWPELLAGREPLEASVSMAAMAPALMLFTSGTTGKPKGTVHSHAGCLAQMGKELLYNFDLRAEDRFFWLSDIGWMMGPWEIIGCLSHGATLLIYEGAPDYPAPDRLWQLVARHGVTQLGVSPTAVRLLMRSGDSHVERHDLSSLHTLGSTGEAWDPASYAWFFERVGRGRCPIINISGGTDIAGCFLAPLPTVPLKATSLQMRGLGMDVDVFDESGRSVTDEVGYLVCKQPTPSMTRGLWKHPAKYLDTYWSQFPGVWSHGDWAKLDPDGHWFLFGRADDTLKIAGRRVGPGEIEAALTAHPAVSEAAAVGFPDSLKGTDVVCFVVLHEGYDETDSLREQLAAAVVAALGKVDRPREVRFVDDLPKTRSAKIVRRLIQRCYLGEGDVGDVTNLANPDALRAIARSR